MPHANFRFGSYFRSVADPPPASRRFVVVGRSWRRSPGNAPQRIIMTRLPGHPAAASAADDAARARHDRQLEQLIGRLPHKLQPTVRWLRRPSQRWVRLPAGALLVVGGLLSILPLLGLWMLPLGLVLLAEDIASLRRARGRALDWVERHRPHWLRS